MDREIYLDNSATTRPYDEVIEYMSEINRNIYGNPSSLHTKGIEAERLVKTARDRIAICLEADMKEIYFTSGGTESNNLAIKGYIDANPRKGRSIITTKVEHPSVMEVFKHLENTGYKVDYIDVDQQGKINLKQLEDKINETTSFISIMLVNNETGAIQPIEEIAAIKNNRNNQAVLHVDAVQAFGKLNVLPKKSGIDLLSVSSHKIHGPKGVGALYASKAIRLKPVLFGGGQESTLRSGTENVPGIAGFGLAAEMTYRQLDEGRKKAVNLKTGFLEKLKDCSFEYRVLSSMESSPFILNISFGGLRSEVLLHHLEERNIFVSTGSACSSRKNKKSHVLAAMGLPANIIDGALRFSFSIFNHPEDIADTINALNDIVPRIQTRRKNR
jgi:cysteine desulfurase